MPINEYELRTMMEAVEEMKAPSTFLLDTFFPAAKRKTFDTEHVDYDYVSRSRRLAPFSNVNGPGVIIPRTGFEMRSVTPLNMAPTRPITAADLEVRQPGRHVYNPISPEQRANELMSKDLGELKDMNTRTMEWCAAQILMNNAVTLFGVGVGGAITFNRLAAHQRAALGGADLWSAVGTADPYGNIRDWSRSVSQATGLRGDTLILGQGAADALLSNDTLVAQLDTRRIDFGTLSPELISDNVTYLGMLKGTGVEIWAYEETYEDPATGVAGQPIIDNNVAIMTSKRMPTQLVFGAVPVAMGEGDQSVITLVRAEMVPVTWTDNDPAAKWLKVQCRPIPVFKMQDAILVREVI